MKPVKTLAVVLPVLAACYTQVQHFKHPQIGGIKRAAFELQCPEEQLQLVELGDGTVGVTGCGRRAVYKHSMVGWLNNTGGEDVNAPKANP